MINVLPWLWIGFGYLGHMALLKQMSISGSSTTSRSTREMGRFVPCPFVLGDYVQAVKGFK